MCRLQAKVEVVLVRRRDVMSLRRLVEPLDRGIYGFADQSFSQIYPFFPFGKLSKKGSSSMNCSCLSVSGRERSW